MRAIEISEWGIENLKQVDRRRPTPRPGEVLVRINAVSLNYRDYLMIQGQYNPRQPLPLVPCSDGAGVVEACGEGVDEFEPGDRVMPTFFTHWPDGKPTAQSLKTSLGGPIDGTLCEYFCAPASAFVATPEHLSDVEASTLTCAAVTAWSALIAQGRLAAGETVLTLGTGGVSMFAIQFARMHGAHVIATSSSDEKLRILRDEYGVTETLNYRTNPEWGHAARKLSGGGVDHVIEVGGSGTLPRSIQAVRPGGHISLIGVLAESAEPVSLVPVLMRNVRIQGVLVGTKRHFEQMATAISVNGLRPRVDCTFDIANVVDAFKHLRDQKHMGKVVVTL